MKRLMFLWVLGIFLIAAMGGNGLVFAADNQPIKNVILMIPDGMDFDGVTMTRWYNGGKLLTLDSLVSGLIRTYWAGGPVTDSAPAASAMATGFKVGDGMISTLAENTTAFMPGVPAVTAVNSKRPVATILEGARLKGLATGIVVTCEMPHATPAAFSSHNINRNDYDSISEEQVYQGLDVFLGGGYDTLTPGTGAKNRKDGEDLIQVIKNKGYQFVTNRNQMLDAGEGRIWGMFAPMDVPNDMDRDAAVYPGIDEMVRKALTVLAKDPDGFFLLVEGSKIDWSAHSNDPIGVISEIGAFDRAVKVALDFAKKDSQTALIIAPDHNTGGISISRRETVDYNKQPLSLWMNQLKLAKVTGDGIADKFNADRSNIPEVMAKYYGISDLSADEVQAIKMTKAADMRATVGPMISKRANIGWTTGGHTGGEVVLGSYLPGNRRITGLIENTYIAQFIAQSLNIDLSKVNEDLFQNAKEAFEAKGAAVGWDKSDPKNPVFVVTKDAVTAKFPIDKNIAVVNGKSIEMRGLTVYYGMNVYVPREALDLVK